MAAAYRLTQLGFPVVVVEREDRVGGLAKSICYRGFILDYGPHRFFTKIPAVLELWNQVLGSEQVTVRRLTRIYYRKKIFSTPFKLGKFYGKWAGGKVFALSFPTFGHN